MQVPGAPGQEEEEVGWSSVLTVTSSLTSLQDSWLKARPAQPSPAQPSGGEERRGEAFLGSSQVPSDLPASHRASAAQSGHNLLENIFDVSDVRLSSPPSQLLWCYWRWPGPGVVWCGVRGPCHFCGRSIESRAVDRLGLRQGAGGLADWGLTHTIQWSRCSYLLCYRYPYLQLLYHFINVPFLWSR